MMFELVQQKLDENILDFAFFCSKEVLKEAPQILKALLEQEKQNFYKKLSLTDEDLSFDALEDESLLSTFFGLIEHFNSVESNETLRQIIEDFEPLYVAWGDEISYNKEYFGLIQKIQKKGSLGSDQNRIITETIKNYRIRGIDLPAEKQERLKQISQELASLHQKFSNNVLDAESEFHYLVTDESILNEMPNDDKEIAKKKAEKEGKIGWSFDASWGSYSSIMTYCSDREVRKYFYTEKNKFASEGTYDNRQIILKILAYRNEKAQILGYPNYASYSFEYKMASSPNDVIKLIDETALKAKEKAQQEIQILKDFFHLTEIDSYDTSYYARKYKHEKFQFDEKKLKEYFEVESTIRGMFQIASLLFGIEFTEITDKNEKKYHPDIRLYEVKKDGVLKAYLMGDYFNRKGKRPGAWANNIRSKFIHNGKNKLPIVVNVGNFQKNEGEKSLLPLRDVETMFHEFGHALHEMLSESKYSELSGFGVELDFVELPSQLMENWCSDKIALDLFARHAETGAGIPSELLETMKASEMFGKGMFLLRQNDFSYLDMILHTSKVPQTVQELDEMIFTINEKNSLFPRGREYKQYATFHHLFDGGYAAGYYSYMWSEIIEVQVWDIFKSAGVMTPEIGKKYYDIVLAGGSRRDGIDIFKEFTGTDIDLKPFLQRYGIE